MNTGNRYATKFIEEVRRLGIMDPADGSKFLFGADFGYYNSPRSVDERMGPLWMSASIDGYEFPELAGDDGFEWYRAGDQKNYANNRRYPNRRYTTLSSKYGRKLCRYGCLWVFDKDVIGKTIYLSFGVGHELLGADWICVPVVPMIRDERDMGILDPGVTAYGAGIELRVFPEEMPGRGGEPHAGQRITIYNAAPSYDSNPDGFGAWHGRYYDLGRPVGADDRFDHIAMESEIICTNTPQRENERYRLAADGTDIAACNLCRMMF